MIENLDLVRMEVVDPDPAPNPDLIHNQSQNRST